MVSQSTTTYFSLDNRAVGAETGTVDLETGIKRVSYESASEIRQKLTSDRWNDLHAGKKVLVIDDNQDTASSLCTFLRELYGQVDTETDSTKVLQRLVEAKESGAPYDAIVLDLYMPQKTGIEILKELAARGDMPAVVVNTASMMSQTVADISTQMDSYRSRAALETAQALLTGSSASHNRDFGMLLHFKLDGLTALIDKIDAAQLFAAHGKEAIVAFWKEFDPLLIPINYNAEAVHYFCEHLRNFLTEYGEIWSDLQQNHALQGSLWLSQNAQRIENALEQLKEVSFGTLMDDTPSAIRNRIHNALNAFARLNPEWVSGGETRLLSTNDPGVVHAALKWRRSYTGYQAKLNGIYSEFQSYHAAAFDFRDFCTNCFAGISGYNGGIMFREDTSIPALKDPERALRAFLVELSKVMRSLNGNEWRQLNIYPGFCAEKARIHERRADREKLDAMNCGDYFMLNFSFDCTSPTLDPYFAELLPRMSELVKKGLMRWDTSSWMSDKTKRWQFDITIKASDKSIDFEREAQEKAKKKPDGTRIITTEFSEIEVSEDLGRDKNLIRVGELPDKESRGARPVLFKLGDKIIFANCGAHIEGCNLIAQYLNFIKMAEPDSPLASQREYRDAADIYEDCLRIRISYGTITLDGLPNGENIRWASEALEDLGYVRIPVEVNSEDFAEKPSYR